MTHCLTLVCPPGGNGIKAALKVLVAAGHGPLDTNWLAAERAVDIRLSPAPVAAVFHRLFADIAVDWAIQKEQDRRKCLFLSDMDSTMIVNESIDELAVLAGVGAEIAALTRRAMEGELDFEASVKRRVAALKGLPLTALETCWHERIRLSDGAELVLKTLSGLGIRTVLVSGGFTFFTALMAARLGFDAHFANRLEVADGRLTGRITPPILGPDAKRERLLRELADNGLRPAQSLAVGDGANDLPMLTAAGLGIAYKAKPIVKADGVINHTDLTSLLYFIGVSVSASLRRVS